MIWLVCVLAAQGSHGIVDHADLRAVSMGYNDFATFFDEVHDSLSGNLNSYHLLRKCVAKCVAPNAMTIRFFLFSIVKFPFTGGI